MLEKYLDDLEQRIDGAGEAALRAQWDGFTDGAAPQEGVFRPRRAYSAAPGVEWPSMRVNDALADCGLMILSQLADCSGALANGSGRLLAVRANYGTGILSSLFGAEVFWMDRSLDTLPTTKPLPGGADAVKRLLDAGVPDLQGGLGARTLEAGRRFVAEFAPYPKIREWVAVYHPDIQGPMDVAELVWGSQIFYEFIDNPALVHSFLALVTETYAAFMREWQKIVPPAPDGKACHWGMLHKGCIMLRDDSAMNLSGEAFEEFIRPYDQRLLDEFGGGAVHFCGHGDHFIEPMCRMRGMHAVNLSQPHLNDMERIFRCTVDQGIALIGFDSGHAARAQAAGRALRGRVQAW